jgi:hypothetical protein
MKIRYDVSDVPAGGFPQPDPGLYVGKVSKVEDKVAKSGNKMLEVTLKIVSGGKKKWKGVTVRTWIVYADAEGNPNEATAWKLREFIDALGLKAKGALDIRKIVGTELQFKVDADSDDNGDYRARVGTLTPLAEDEEEDDDHDDDDDADEDDDDTDEDDESDEDDDDDADEADDDDDEDDDDEDDEDEEDDDEDDEPVDFKSLPLDELKVIAKERGIKTTIKRKGEALKGAALKKALVEKIEADIEDDSDPFA